MLQVNNRKGLDNLFSKKQVVVQDPEPITEAKQPDSTPTSIALGVVVDKLEYMTKVMQEHAASKKKLEATIHRDSDGRMARVTINVV